MAIFIGRRPEEQYTRVPNTWARDPKLSTKAKGMLLYLLSHQTGYRLTVQQVIAENADGRDAIYKTLAELVSHGYLRRDQRRGERGKVGEVDYYVADAPGQTAYGFTASGESGSGDDQGKQEESAGQTASGFSVSGSAVSGKPATKKTRVKKTKVQEDQKKTTSPNPSADVALADVVDAEIVEEGDFPTSSLEHQIQELIDEAGIAKPHWRRRRTEVREQIDALLVMFDGSFDIAAKIVRGTATAPDSGVPARITHARNPAMVRANAEFLIAKADAFGSVAPASPPHPDAHPFDRSDYDNTCKRCTLPEGNQRHKVGNQGGGYRAQASRSPDRRNGPWRPPGDQSEYDRPFSGQAAAKHQTFKNPTDPNAYRGEL